MYPLTFRRDTRGTRYDRLYRTLRLGEEREQQLLVFPRQDCRMCRSHQMQTPLFLDPFAPSWGSLLGTYGDTLDVENELPSHRVPPQLNGLTPTRAKTLGLLDLSSVGRKIPGLMAFRCFSSPSVPYVDRGTGQTRSHQDLGEPLDLSISAKAHHPDPT